MNILTFTAAIFNPSTFFGVNKFKHHTLLEFIRKVRVVEKAELQAAYSTRRNELTCMSVTSVNSPYSLPLQACPSYTFTIASIYYQSSAYGAHGMPRRYWAATISAAGQKSRCSGAILFPFPLSLLLPVTCAAPNARAG